MLGVLRTARRDAIDPQLPSRSEFCCDAKRGISGRLQAPV
jgi:hypothetical protein